MLVGILKKLVGIMIGPVGILKNACRYFETVGIMNVDIMNVGIKKASREIFEGVRLFNLLQFLDGCIFPRLRDE